MKDRIKRHAVSLIIIVGLIALSVGVFIYSGIYNIGADDHHSKLVFTMLQTLRNRSIELRSATLSVPNLDDPALILKGAGQYAAMCTQCHLAPGKRNSEIRVGMYPQPPDFSKTRTEPRAAFWVIKHGIKMSAMPAWGSSHDDPTIWSMVAFLGKLPDMSPDEYKTIVARAPPDEDMDIDATSSDHSDHD
jgi:mono/diheme cytochrome c family protein